jgi:hypothetical protein
MVNEEGVIPALIQLNQDLIVKADIKQTLSKGKSVRENTSQKRKKKYPSYRKRDFRPHFSFRALSLENM